MFFLRRAAAAIPRFAIPSACGASRSLSREMGVSGGHMAGTFRYAIRMPPPPPPTSRRPPAPSPRMAVRQAVTPRCLASEGWIFARGLRGNRGEGEGGAWRPHKSALGSPITNMMKVNREQIRNKILDSIGAPGPPTQGVVCLSANSIRLLLPQEPQLGSATPGNPLGSHIAQWNCAISNSRILPSFFSRSSRDARQEKSS